MTSFDLERFRVANILLSPAHGHTTGIQVSAQRFATDPTNLFTSATAVLLCRNLETGKLTKEARWITVFLRCQQGCGMSFWATAIRPAMLRQWVNLLPLFNSGIHGYRVSLVQFRSPSPVSAMRLPAVALGLGLYNCVCTDSTHMAQIRCLSHTHRKFATVRFAPARSMVCP